MNKEEIQYEDLKELIFGDFLGSGVYRKVGVFEQDKSLVIKCAFDNPNINFLEYEVWEMVKDTYLAKWFSPVISISPNGMFLLQKRVDTKPQKEYPKLVPKFFSDLKYSNYGWLNGKFVCVDYASFLSTSMYHKWSDKLVKANWW